MRKLLISVALGAFALMPVANAQTTNHQPPATRSPRQYPLHRARTRPPFPRPAPGRMLRPSLTGWLVTQLIKSDMRAIIAKWPLMGTASGKRHMRQARLSYRYAGRHHRHRVMGYRAASVRCR